MFKNACKIVVIKFWKNRIKSIFTNHEYWFYNIMHFNYVHSLYYIYKHSMQLKSNDKVACCTCKIKPYLNIKFNILTY